MLQRSTQLKLILMFCSLGLSLYVVELAIVISQGGSASSRRNNVVMARRAGMSFDTRTKAEVIAPLRSEGKRAFPSVFPEMFWHTDPSMRLLQDLEIQGRRVLPLRGIPDVTTVFCNESGKYSIFQSDELGFHNPKGLHDTQGMEIVAVGDSFTQGACVDSDQNLISIIRETRPKTLNLGMGGNGPLSALGTVEEFAKDLRPKVLLWIYYEGNDLLDLSVEAQSPLIQYLDPGYRQNLRSLQSEISLHLTRSVEHVLGQRDFDPRTRQLKTGAEADSSWTSRRLWRDVVLLVDLRQRLGLRRSKSPSHAPIAADVELLKRVLSRARQSVNSWGGTLQFVYLPSWESYAQTAYAKSLPEQIQFVSLFNRPRPLGLKTRADVLSVVRELQIPVIDVFEIFAEHKDPLSLFPFRQGNHYNPQGYRVAAEAILRGLAHYE